MIDLYSDTLTKPSPAMRRAMADAEVADEQRREDPTTNKLQETIAELLGKEAAVFLPSGSVQTLRPPLGGARRGYTSSVGSASD